MNASLITKFPASTRYVFGLVTGESPSDAEQKSFGVDAKTASGNLRWWLSLRDAHNRTAAFVLDRCFDSGFDQAL